MSAEDLGAHSSRAAAKWRWEPDPNVIGPSAPCGMVTSTGKRCIKGWMHRLGHATRLAVSR